MPSDFPDWGGQYNDKQFFPLFDQAELAARLGSLMTYDRRGSVIWQYHFEHGIGDTGPGGIGVSSTAVLYASQYEFPPFACKMQAGGAAGSYYSVERRLPVPQPALVGFQASVRLTPGVEEVRHFIYHYDGASRWYANLVVNQRENKLQVWVDPGVPVDLIDPLTDLNSGYYFAHLKIVCDLSTHKLVRGILDRHEFDLSQYTMVVSADAEAENLRGRIMVFSVTGATTVCVVGSMIFTVAEPPN